ncbi:MAG: hypothetical protein J5856_00215 [Lachnospiraceae bacterium]|nr:hypothetical protein [Lachnospiraceae bacterium]
MDILFAENSDKKTVQLKPETLKDLGLNEIIENITEGEKEMLIVKDVITKIPSDIRDIRFRQEIMRDFLSNENLAAEFNEALWQIRTLKDYSTSRLLLTQNDNSLYVLLEYLRELSVYVNVLEKTKKCLDNNNLNSEGLKKLREQVDKVIGDKEFEEIKEDINKMLDNLTSVQGAIVGVNFTPELDVEQVSVVEFVPYKVRSKYKFAEIAASLSLILNSPTASNQNAKFGMDPRVRVPDPLLVTMTPQIEKHLKRHFTRIKSAMSKYVTFDGSLMTDLFEGLTFYLCMARFAQRLKKEGLQICLPDLPQNDDSSSRDFSIKDLYNIRLFFAGEKNIIKNDLSFSPGENLYILTGPNRGGKTIIEQAVGIISVMASSGAFVTASNCSGRPFTNILTHFPIDENLTINYGRLGEEAVRIKEIVKEADDKTLILFNETYSTTSAVDGLYLSKDLLRILKETGSAVIFNTHIHEVARSIEEMNSWPGESSFVSLVMEIQNNVNTFKVKRSDPDSKSYAKNIAEKYGITYEQMKKEKSADEN